MPRGFCGRSVCLGRRNYYRSLREHGAPVMDQALQSMGRDIQGRVIHGNLFVGSGFGTLHFENIVDFFFDVHQLGLRASVPNPARHGIQRIERAFAETRTPRSCDGGN